MLFNRTNPNNHQLDEALKSQFQAVYDKVDGLRQWLEEAPGLNFSRGGSKEVHREEEVHHSNQSVSQRQTPPVSTEKIPTLQPSPQPSHHTPPHNSPLQTEHIPEKQETPPHFKNLAEHISSPSSNDSPATT